jgi:hypothetical protein
LDGNPTTVLARNASVAAKIVVCIIRALEATKFWKKKRRCALVMLKFKARILDKSRIFTGRGQKLGH